MPLNVAREKSLKLDWKDFTPKRPSFLGKKIYRHFPLNELLQFVDWKCFFDVWELRGKYPNGRYPKIFNDETVGNCNLTKHFKMHWRSKYRKHSNTWWFGSFEYWSPFEYWTNSLGIWMPLKIGTRLVSAIWILDISGIQIPTVYIF